MKVRVGRARAGLVAGAVTALLSLCSVVPSQASGSRQTILVLSPESADPVVREAHEQLQRALEAHLSAYPVVVRIHRNGADVTPVAAAARAEEAGAIAVTWLGTDALFTLAPALLPEPVERALPTTTEGSAAFAESLAAMVASALTPLLDGLLDDPPAADEVTDAEQPAVTGTEEVTAPVQVPAETAARKGPPVHLVVAGGWVPVRLSPDLPLLHGVGLAGGVLLGEHLELGVGLDLVQRVPLELEQGQAGIGRLPLRLSGIGYLTFPPLELGMVLGAVVEVSRVRDLPHEPADGTSTRPHAVVGLTPALRVRVRPWSFLGIFADVGGDFFFSTNEYLDDGVLLLTRQRSLIRLQIGVVGALRVSRRSE